VGRAVTSPAIRIDHLSRDFGPVKALDGLSLEVPLGSIFGFLGPNGSGKTTTIHLLLGLLEPSGGRAEVLGFDTVKQGDAVRARTGALLEHAGLYEQMTAEENLEFYGRVNRMSAGERQSRMKELLQRFDLWERRKDRVVKWSRGMKQKLAIARALLHRPSLVFLDEPTAGLDVVAAAAVREDLATLAAGEGVTFFLTTHNMAEAEKLCRRVAVIRQGRLLAVGHPDELRARTNGPCVEVVGRSFSQDALDLLRGRPEVSAVEREDNRLSIHLRRSGEVAPLITLLVNAGVEVEEVLKDKASLEEVFLKLMEEEQ
jgi:ABC-2 type transport system ATP-binding protein